MFFAPSKRHTFVPPTGGLQKYAKKTKSVKHSLHGTTDTSKTLLNADTTTLVRQKRKDFALI
ncbi:MAG: hypothetical protein LC687_02635, partial [Actinobacteria bacterium]|nr:hypothetical protein [Actinomycetota bacterium]